VGKKAGAWLFVFLLMATMTNAQNCTSDSNITCENKIVETVSTLPLSEDSQANQGNITPADNERFLPYIIAGGFLVLIAGFVLQRSMKRRKEAPAKVTVKPAGAQAEAIVSVKQVAIPTIDDIPQGASPRPEASAKPSSSSGTIGKPLIPLTVSIPTLDTPPPEDKAKEEKPKPVEKRDIYHDILEIYERDGSMQSLKQHFGDDQIRDASARVLGLFRTIQFRLHYGKSETDIISELVLMGWGFEHVDRAIGIVLHKPR
jgi:hypothetical protein